MNSACLRKRARNDSVLSFGTKKVLARTMGPVFSLNCANIGVCGSRLCSLAIFRTSSRYRAVGVAGARVLGIPAEVKGVCVRVLDWMEVAVPHFGRTAERLRVTAGRVSPWAQVR